MSSRCPRFAGVDPLQTDQSRTADHQPAAGAAASTRKGRAWTDHGAVMLEPRFDHVRRAVLGEARDGFFAMLTKGNPNRTVVSLTYWLQPDGNGEWRMPVCADYFGVILATDSRLPGPLQDQPAEFWNVTQFAKSDVR